MKRLHYQKDINATADKVFITMLGLEDISTYEQWTAIFNPTSTYEGRWERGAKMYFVGTDETGKRVGMMSEVVEFEPDRFVSICHYGMLKDDKEITEGPEVEKWAGGLENYSFEEKGDMTTLTIDIDATEEHIGYFDETWPKALNRLAELAEAEQA